MFIKPSVLTVLSGLALLGTIEMLRLFSDGSLDNFWRLYNGGVIEPLELVSLFLLVIGIPLFLFNQTIQQKWWRWARWMLLGSIPIILTGSTSGYTWLRRTDLAILCGSVLLGSTLLYVLVQRFYYKTGAKECGA